MKRSLLRILRDEGFIENVETHRDGAKADFEVKLRYYEDDESVITGLKRISKPGRRVYVGKNEIPRYFGGRGGCVPFDLQGRDDIGSGTSNWRWWRVALLRLVI